MKPIAATIKTVFACFAFIILGLTFAQSEVVVKLSKSGICHAPDSQYYSRTKHFKPYNSLAECLEKGRLPKNYRPSGHLKASVKQSSKTLQNTSKSTYNRELFGAWGDEDGDCQNTRHELLAEISSVAPTYNAAGCRVIHGRWLDPYTNKVFLDAKDMDVDHLVPLKWAWDHGAVSWNVEKRKAFANDMRNLFAVQASVNREKGALGPLKWLPPNKKFHCEYITRFKRITVLYKLNLSSDEALRFNSLRDQICK
ncbi:Protein of unknown function [Pseudovibrio denitrificans]|uniref:GmrSD restriction endonucleases C-terminal domain-containing protein n=1 Tax=Pseudovibrio denitrificans TaxID=258256 RepID=A0A1I7DZA9_9HYPH|nr:HNH endonuclease family protein [Pseudovibrio denitrificans]SFU17032.1 Protein of unknown function [Pseudovibrio denitrificans]